MQNGFKHKVCEQNIEVEPFFLLVKVWHIQYTFNHSGFALKLHKDDPTFSCSLHHKTVVLWTYLDCFFDEICHLETGHVVRA